MTDILSLSCLNCNSKFIIKNIGIKQFVCNNCGREYLIKREGGITYLEEMEPSFDLVEKNTQTNSVQDMPFEGNTEDNLGNVKTLMGFEDKQPITNLPPVGIGISDLLSDDENITKRIDIKISKLHFLQDGIRQDYAKSKVTYTVLCLVTLVIIYAIFPIFDNYSDLFIAIGITFSPVIIGFLILFLINRKAAQSNYHFIETVIINLRKERDNQV